MKFIVPFLFFTVSTHSLAQSYNPLILESNLNRGDTLAAIRYLDEVTRAGSQSWQAYYNLAVLQFGKDMKPAALPNFRRAVDLNPALWETTYYLGHIYYSLDSMEQAVLNYSEYLAHEPVNKEVRHYRAEAYMKVNDFFNAVSDWTLLYNDTNDPHILYNRALALMGLNDQVAAREDLKKVIEENPGMVSARYYMGLSFKRSYDIKEAVHWWSELLEQWPKHMPSLYQLSVYYFEKGRKRKACEYFRQAVRQGYEPINSDQPLVEACN